MVLRGEKQACSCLPFRQLLLDPGCEMRQEVGDPGGTPPGLHREPETALYWPERHFQEGYHAHLASGGANAGNLGSAAVSRANVGSSQSAARLPRSRQRGALLMQRESPGLQMFPWSAGFPSLVIIVVGSLAVHAHQPRSCCDASFIHGLDHGLPHILALYQSCCEAAPGRL